jgi:hypothetical protein
MMSSGYGYLIYRDDLELLLGRPIIYIYSDFIIEFSKIVYAVVLINRLNVR